MPVAELFRLTKWYVVWLVAVGALNAMKSSLLAKGHGGCTTSLMLRKKDPVR
jgi:hypothetical protein